MDNLKLLWMFFMGFGLGGLACLGFMRKSTNNYKKSMDELVNIYKRRDKNFQELIKLSDQYKDYLIECINKLLNSSEEEKFQLKLIKNEEEK